jgi:hypothetical protein
MRILLLLLLLLPQVAAARVYMCADPVTGKTSFSDKGCQPATTQEEVRVQSTNVDSGRRTTEKESVKTWVSDRDTRKTGLDYIAERRGLNATNATAIADSDGS